MKTNLPSVLAASVVLGLLSTYALAQMGGGQFSKMVTAQSGVKKMVAHHHSSHFQGNMVPYSIKP